MCRNPRFINKDSGRTDQIRRQSEAQSPSSWKTAVSDAIGIELPCVTALTSHEHPPAIPKKYSNGL